MNSYKVVISVGYCVQDNSFGQKWRKAVKSKDYFIDASNSNVARQFAQNVLASKFICLFGPWQCLDKRDRKESFYRKTFQPSVKNITAKRQETHVVMEEIGVTPLFDLSEIDKSKNEVEYE